MTKTRLIIIAVVAIIFLLVYVLAGDRNSGFRREVKAFAVDDTASVVKIFLADKTNKTILLERQPDRSWKVNGTYKARRDLTDLLLGTMKNLEVRMPVPKAAYNTVISNMASRSVKVEVYQKKYRFNLFDKIRAFPFQKRTKVYYIGDVTPDNIGTFMILENSDMPFVVYWPGFRGFVASRYSVNLDDWRDHTIFSYKINQIASVEVLFSEHPSQNLRVAFPDRQHAVIGNTRGDVILPAYDTIKLLSFLTAFENIRFESLLNDLDRNFIDSVSNSVPLHIIRVSGVNGSVNEVKTFRRKAVYTIEDEQGSPYEWDVERMYALINNEQDFVLVQYFVFDKILKPLDYFRVRQ